VTGSTEHAPGDDIVTTILVDPTGKANNQGEPIEVDFRVENENGRYVVIDVSIAGVFLAQEEHDEFTSFLHENHESVQALISNLNALTQRLHSGGHSTPTH
jgi:ABC-type transporter MlaC component